MEFVVCVAESLIEGEIFLDSFRAKETNRCPALGQFRPTVWAPLVTSIARISKFMIFWLSFWTWGAIQRIESNIKTFIFVFEHVSSKTNELIEN